MERNIKLNGLQHAAKAVIYDWSNPTPSRLPAKPDIVLAADCVYFEPAFPLLQQTLKDLLGSNTICYFCFRKRRRADLSFIKTVKKMFDVKEVQDDPDETYSKENIYLFVIHSPTIAVPYANPKQVQDSEEVVGYRQFTLGEKQVSTNLRPSDHSVTLFSARCSMPAIRFATLFVRRLASIYIINSVYVLGITPSSLSTMNV